MFQKGLYVTWGAKTMSFANNIPQIAPSASTRNMKAFRGRTALIALILLTSATSYPIASVDAQPVADPSAVEQETIVFHLATDVLPSGGIKLANGVEVLASDWPTLILAQIRTVGALGEVKSTCTATLVGPNVALMAAHCVDDVLSLRPRLAKLEVDGRTIELSCEIHPEYLKHDPKFRMPRGSEDYALCLIEDGGDPPYSLSALRFEVVDDASSLAAGEAVLMTGYGCSDLKITDCKLSFTLPAEKILRIGDELVDTGSPGPAESPHYVTVRSINGREPALCPGDSGGPLFTGATTSHPTVLRRVRGVNSLIAVQRSRSGSNDGSRLCNNDDYDIISSMSVTGTQIFQLWARDWLSRNMSKGPLICGINAKAEDIPCRD